MNENCKMNQIVGCHVYPKLVMISFSVVINSLKTQIFGIFFLPTRISISSTTWFQFAEIVKRDRKDIDIHQLSTFIGH